MRIAILWLLPMMVFAQSAQERARDLVERAYRMERVQRVCLADPSRFIEVEVDGFRVVVDCSIWLRWYEANQR